MKFIFTNDDACGSEDPRHVDWFNTVVSWLDGQGIPGSFFLIPKAGDKPADQKKEWVDAVKSAGSKGHEFQLHGYRHDSCLEFGLPPPSSRVVNPGPFEEYRKNVDKWKFEHSFENLGVKLADGIEIFGRVLGEKPLVFRSPCFSMCDDAYVALKQAGISYSSSRGINPIATAYTVTKQKQMRAWEPDFPSRPWNEKGGVLEMPCMEDLVIWGVPETEYDDRLDLYKNELMNYIRELGDWKFGVFGTHYHSMMATWQTTRRLYEELFDWLRSLGISGWTTFGKELK